MTQSLLLLLLASLAVGSAPPVLHHLPLQRHDLPASRLFNHARRPWAWHPAVRRTFPVHQQLAHPLRLAEQPGLNVSERLPQHPLKGNIVTLGEYYLTLTFGGQPINVQIDTGSSTLAVPLKQCRNCMANDNRLDLDTAKGTTGFISCSSPACRENTCNMIHSCRVCSARTHACCSTIAPEMCGFFLRYVDKSGASGALVQADVGIAGMEVPLLFGAILQETSDFEQPNVDGIFGMAYPTLACNPSCVTPLFDTLVQTGKVKHDIFSICTAPDGGTLTLGGSSPSFYKGELQYVPMLKKGAAKHFYDIAVKGVSIGGSTVKVPDFGDAIVDSGTTVLVLAPRAYQALKKHFQTNYCKVPGLCVGRSGKQIEPTRVIKGPAKLTGREDLEKSRQSREDASWFSPGYCATLKDHHLDMLPDITITLANGVELVLEPEVYMLRYEQTSTFAWDKIVYRCLGISYVEGLEHMENNAILGNTVLQKYFIEYDRENDRIGIAIAKNCVDPAARMLGLGPSVGQEGFFALPHWTTVLLIFGTIISWVVLISLCAQKRQEGYNPIPGSNTR